MTLITRLKQPTMSSRPQSRLPWILFQGLVLGLPVAGLILLTTWILRFAGINLPWSPALGLSIGVLSGSLSLAAFQTFDHASPRGLEAEEGSLADASDESAATLEPVQDSQQASLLARMTAGILVGSMFGLPTALAIFAIGAIVGLVMGDLARLLQPAGLTAALAYYVAIGVGIRKSLA